MAVICEAAAQKLKVEDDNRTNRISDVPEDIALDILSFLTLKENLRNCVLSRWWVKKWRHCTILNFEPTDSLRQQLKLLVIPRRNWFANWVDKVLLANKAPELEEFSICFNLSDAWKGDHDVARWVGLAMLKGVKKIELDFRRNGNCKLSKNCLDCIENPCGFSGIKSQLTSLCLRGVGVTGEVVEKFCSKCPLLERLVVESSRDLISVRVDSPSLSYLEVRCCYSLEKLKICAPNLTLFKYQGKSIQLHMEYPSQPVQVDFRLSQDPNFAFSPTSSYFDRLETVNLDINARCLQFSDQLELSKLQHLNVTINYGKLEQNLLGLVDLIGASPSLYKLLLLIRAKQEEDRELLKWPTCYAEKKPHTSLKMVEMVGFAGCDIDYEFAKYVLTNASTLEKFTLDARYPNWDGTRGGCHCNKKKTQEARQKAAQLKSEAPAIVEFVIR